MLAGTVPAMANNISADIDIMYVHRNDSEAATIEIECSSGALADDSALDGHSFIGWIEMAYTSVHEHYQNSCSHCTYNGQ